MRPRLLAVLTSAALLGAVPLLVPAAGAADPVRVLDGDTRETSVFPSDRFTVRDAAQATGLRVDLPVPTCTEATRSTCEALRILNTADGFDLQPRFFIPFSGDIDVATVTPETAYVEGPGGRIGLQELTFDPGLDVLAARTREQLPEQTRHVLVITRSVRGTDGRPLADDVRVPFTTMSATTELARLRPALDDARPTAAEGSPRAGQLHAAEPG
jgi:hypothetical protein